MSGGRVDRGDLESIIIPFSWLLFHSKDDSLFKHKTCPFFN